MQLIIFFFLMMLYLAGIAPSVYSGDCGELAAAAHTLSIAHPPGFPLYCIIYNAFSSLTAFFGTPVFRMNLLTSILAVTSGFLFFKTFVKRGVEPVKAWTGAILFVISFSTLDQARGAEVYCLQLFLFSLNLYGAACFSKKGSWKSGAFYFFTLGLGLANHPYLFGVSAVAGGVWVLRALWRYSRRIQILAMLLFMLPGLLCYLYLPLRSAEKPPLMWGSMETPAKVAAHVMRSKYGPLTVNNYSIELTIKQFSNFFIFIKRQLPFGLHLAGLLFLIIMTFKMFFKLGYLFHFKSGESERELLNEISFSMGAWIVFLSPILIVNYTPSAKNIYINEPFFLMGLPFLSLYTSGIIIGLFKWISDYPGSRSFRLFFKSNRPVSLLLLFFYFLALRAQPPIEHLEAPAAYVKNCIRSTTKNASIFSTGDLLYLPWLNFRLIEKYRTDISVFQINGFIFKENPGLLRKLIIQGIERGGAYVANPSDFNGGNEFLIKPWGFLYRVFLKNSSSHKIELSQFPPWRWFNTDLLKGEPNDYLLRGLRRETREMLGEYLWNTDKKKDAVKEFIKSYEEVDYFESSEYNLGCIFFEHKLFEEALKQFELAKKRDPSHRDTWLNLCICLDEINKKSKAVQILREYMNSFGQDVMVWNNLGALYTSLGKKNLAIDSYKQALIIDDSYKNARLQLLRNFADIEDYSSMLGYTDHYVYNKKYDPEILYWRALALVRLNEHNSDILGKAIKIAELSANIDIQNPSALTLMGEVFMRIGDNGQALRAYLEAISRGENKPEVLFNLAELLRDSKPDESAAYYKKVMNSKNSKLAEKALKRLEQL